MFYIHDPKNAKTLPNGVIREIKGHTGELMVCELHWEKGMVGEPHSHPHIQCGYIIRGSFEAEIDGEKRILGAGDCFYTEKEQVHGLICLEDNSLMLDIFTPRRDDLL